MNRRHRGYTVIELAIAALVATVVVLGLVRWIVSVTEVAHMGLRQTSSSDLVLAQARIRQDLQEVTFCTTNGTDARLRSLEADEIVVIVDVDGDNDTEAVAWRINGTNLERSVAQLDATCLTPAFSQWAVWVDDLLPESGFHAVVDGVLSEQGTSGECFNEFSARCAVDAVSVDLFQSGDAGQKLSAVYEVAGGRDILNVGSPTSRLTPGRVIGLASTAGNAQVALEWSAPLSNGWPVVDYVISYSDDDGATWTDDQDGVSAATTSTVDGLTNGVRYAFRVTAVNENGQGDPSAPIEATPFPPAGTALWAVRGGGGNSDSTTSVAAGSTFVAAAGWYESSDAGGMLTGAAASSGRDAYVAVLNPASGATARLFTGGGAGADTAASVAVAGTTAVVVGRFEQTPTGFLTGAGTTAGGSDAYVAALDTATGSVLWAVRAGGAGQDAATSVSVNAIDGRVYVSGTYEQTPTGFLAALEVSDGGTDGFVAALDLADGSKIWAVRTGGTGNDAATAVAADPHGGTVYAAGHYSSTATGFAAAAGSSAGGDDAYVAAFNTANGAPIWVARAGGVDDDRASALSADYSIVTAAGTFGQTPTGFLSALGSAGAAPDGWVAGFSRASGTVLWTSRADSVEGEAAASTAGASDALLFAGGSYEQTPGGLAAGVGVSAGDVDVWLSGLDPSDGSRLWGVRGGGQGADTVSGTSTGQSGWLFAGGAFSGTPTGFFSTVGAGSGPADAWVACISPGPVDW